MEFSKENLQLQVSALSHETPNQETSFLNEDIAITTEKIIEKPDSVVIEKQSVIQKKVVVKETRLVPKQSVMICPPHQPLVTNASLLIDESACFSNSEVPVQDSEECSKMETSSQGSLDSTVDMVSQGSADSKMDISSQESSSLDSNITPNTSSCVQSNGKNFKIKEFIDPVGNGVLLQPTTASEIARKRKNTKVEKIKKFKVERKKKSSIVKKGQKLKKSTF